MVECILLGLFDASLTAKTSPLALPQIYCVCVPTYECEKMQNEPEYGRALRLPDKPRALGEVANAGCCRGRAFDSESFALASSIPAP
jgi:hypothetical protein